MTPEEIEAAAIRPLIKNILTPVPVEELKTVITPDLKPVVKVKQHNTQVKIVGRSQYMRDMLTVE